MWKKLTIFAPMSVDHYKDLRIIYMGTPEFAVTSLDALVKAGCTIVAVITAPDKPAGRGMELQQSAVKNMPSAKTSLCFNLKS
ncbi:hypothetical protein [Niabella hibiscisoli]|uniref:hypothetical protein n=1 Tax=Niabella hibiscisoli TaxID=1825928 RepID=UPI001F0D6686|nr:hypothetical protein [Niabella hibiscisoli]MCH5719165.1 hypothetical protein [Niabella hibiscisoli]